MSDAMIQSDAVKAVEAAQFTYPRDSAKLRAQMSERARELHLDEAPT